MQWLAPQSRFILKTFFKRNYDVLSSNGQTMVNRMVLGVDIAALIALFSWL